MTYSASTVESEVRNSYAQRWMPSSTFGKNVRAVMQERGLDQQALMDRLSVKQGTLSDWLRDRRGVPEGPTLLRFAKVLHVSVDRLLAGVDDDYDAIIGAPRPAPAPLVRPAIDPTILAQLAAPQTAAEVRAFLRLDDQTRQWLLSAPELQRPGAGSDHESTPGQPRTAGATRGKRPRR